MFARTRGVHSQRIAGRDSARPGWVLRSPPSRPDRVQPGAMLSSETDLRTSHGIVDAVAFTGAASAVSRADRGGFR
jgi:hypothetical protein